MAKKKMKYYIWDSEYNEVYETDNPTQFIKDIMQDEDDDESRYFLVVETKHVKTFKAQNVLQTKIEVNLEA